MNFLLLLLLLATTARAVDPHSQDAPTTALAAPKSFAFLSQDTPTPTLPAPKSLNSVTVDTLRDIVLRLTLRDRIHLRVTSKENNELVNAINALDAVHAKKELDFLDHFGTQNQVSKVEDKFVSICARIFARSRSIPEDDVRKALNVVREVARERCYYQTHDLYLAEELKVKLPKMSVEDIRTSIVKGYQEAWRNVVGGEINAWGISELYREDWRMDFLFTMIVAQQNDPEKLQTDLGNALSKVRVGTNIKDGPNTPVYAQFLINKLMPKVVFETLQKVLQTSQHIRDGSKHQVSRRDVDAQMIKSLLSPLGDIYRKAGFKEAGKITEANIKEAMEQARHAITLEKAVELDKPFAVYGLVASRINCPASRFNAIVVKAYEINFEILNTLRQHISFTTDTFIYLLHSMMKTCNDRDQELLPFLLKDRLAATVIRWAINFIKNNPGRCNLFLPLLKEASKEL